MIKSTENPFKSLIAVLQWRARYQGERLACTFLDDDGSGETRMSYAELDAKARAIAAFLQNDPTEEGCCVLLLYPPGVAYIQAFFGCLYAGAIAVPVYPPRRREAHANLGSVLADTGASRVLAPQRIRTRLERLFTAGEIPPLRLDSIEDLPDELAARWREPRVDGDTVAFLQYTSGSTSDPRGVVLTHANLLYNLSVIHECFGHSSDSRGVIWLPPYHDMGLIGGLLQPLYGGFPVTLLSPLTVAKNPLRWLQAISDYRATTSGGPNFGYELCLSRVRPEQRNNLDLSHWQVAFNGAEPVRADTLQRFSEYFAPAGFRAEAFYPCYGLAEATLMVSGGRKETPPVVRAFAAKALAEHRVVAARSGEPARVLVGCGRPVTGQTLRIVDPETSSVCAPDSAGEIWVAGPGVARGYWNRPVESGKTFQARITESDEGSFLRTGDIGFLYRGELFVTARLDDLIIVDGRNLYPQDIEQTVEHSHEALRAGGAAAIEVDGHRAARLVVLAELDRRYAVRAGRRLSQPPIEPAVLMATIRQLVAQTHGVRVHCVALLQAGSLPRTASGKLRRHVCRSAWLEQRFVTVGEGL